MWFWTPSIDKDLFAHPLDKNIIFFKQINLNAILGI